jgi:hypothetical protein
VRRAQTCVANVEHLVERAPVLAPDEKVQLLLRARAAMLRERALAVSALRNQRRVVVGDGHARVRVTGQSRRSLRIRVINQSGN